jgi:hypothetical protein
MLSSDDPGTLEDISAHVSSEIALVRSRRDQLGLGSVLSHLKSSTCDHMSREVWLFGSVVWFYQFAMLAIDVSRNEEQTKPGERERNRDSTTYEGFGYFAKSNSAAVFNDRAA